MAGRVIVGCSSGEDNPDAVAVAYLTAGAALDQGKEVAMFLTKDAIHLGAPGVAAAPASPHCLHA